MRDFADTPAWDEANPSPAGHRRPALAAARSAPTQIYYFNNYHNKVKQLAFFGEMTYDLTDKWSVTGGLRWFEYDRETVRQVQHPARSAGRRAIPTPTGC